MLTYFIGGRVLVTRILALVIFMFSCQSLFAGHIYLANWEWVSDRGDEYWQSPGGNSTTNIDLRTIPQMGKAGGIPQGYGVFTYDNTQSISGSVYLGDDCNGQLTARQISDLQLALGVVLTSDTPMEMMWDMLTVHSDPSGLTAPKPLRGKRGGNVRLVYGNDIKTEPFNADHLQRTVAVFKEDYKRNKNSGISRSVLQKWTGAEMQKLYGRKSDSLARNMLPKIYEYDGWKHPETTVSDNFNRPNESLDAGNWVELVADWVVASEEASIAVDAFLGTARYSKPLSTDDQIAEVVIAQYSTDFAARHGIIARMDTNLVSAINYYTAVVRGDTDNVRTEKIVDGVDSAIGSDVGISPSAPDTLGIKVDGNIVDSFFNGTLIQSNTDTTITGFLFSGIILRRANGDLDDFKASDLIQLAEGRRFWAGFRR